MRKLSIEITRDCNLACSYCIKETVLNHANIKADFDMANALKVAHSGDYDTVMISGGEPLLCRDTLFELINQLKLPVTVLTNGILFTEEIVSFFNAHSVQAQITVHQFSMLPINAIQRLDQMRFKKVILPNHPFREDVLRIFENFGRITQLNFDFNSLDNIGEKEIDFFENEIKDIERIARLSIPSRECSCSTCDCLYLGGDLKNMADVYSNHDVIFGCSLLKKKLGETGYNRLVALGNLWLRTSRDLFYFTYGLIKTRQTKVPLIKGAEQQILLNKLMEAYSL